jgi:hypothetical protein
MISETAIKDLEEIVNKGLEGIYIPFKRGNSIRIKNLIIRESKNGFLIYNAESNKQVAKTQFKSTAIAIAKNLAAGSDITKKVLTLDIELLKHYNDALFYKNTMKKTKDDSIREIRRIRIDEAIIASEIIRKEIDRLIFNR